MRILFTLAFFILSKPILAEELLFEPQYWDDESLFLNQDSGKVIESILDQNINFEPLVVYHQESLIRTLSKSVGRLKIRYESGKFTTCTGSLVADDLVITNNHCVPGTGRNGLVTAVKLEMGYYSDEGNNSDFMSFDVDITPVNTSNLLDYSLLRVDGDPGADFGTVAIDTQQPESTQQLLLIHHPGGRIKHVTRGRCRAGRITSPSRGSLSHKCDTLPGSSGAPIFSDRNEMVAIHCCGTTVTGRNAFNEGKLLSRIIEHAGDALPLHETVSMLPGDSPPFDVSGEEIIASVTSEPTNEKEDFEQCLSLAYLARDPEDIINCIDDGE